MHYLRDCQHTSKILREKNSIKCEIPAIMYQNICTLDIACKKMKNALLTLSTWWESRLLQLRFSMASVVLNLPSEFLV